MTRLRTNFQSGTITDSPLLVGATTINSAGFSTLPVVAAPDNLILVMDPFATAGAPEIISVVAHTSAATSCTVVRGQEGTTARQHSVNMTWQHNPTALDFTPVIDLGYAERITNFTTTNTVYGDATVGAAGGKVDGLGISVIGNGLPIFIDAFFPLVAHSVANTSLAAYLLINGVVSKGQTGFGTSVSSALGEFLTIRKQTLPLVVGTLYVIEVGLNGGTAGTVTASAGADFPMNLSATAR